MRIAIARRGFSPTGGAEKYLARFAEGAATLGHEVSLATTPDWPANQWSFGPVHRLEARSPRSFADAVRASRPRWKADVFFSLDRVWECDVYRAGDGVHRAWLLRRRAFEAPWKAWFRQSRPSHRQLLALETSLFQGGAGHVIANSRMVAQEIQQWYQTPVDRIHVVPNGYDPPPPQAGAPDRHTLRTSLGIGAGDTLALFSGSGWERKGLADALRAIHTLGTDFHLVIAGTGKRQSLPLCPRATFLGAVSHLTPWFAAADVFVLPTYYDPFSNASLEAARHGLPVLTTRANGFADLLDAGAPGAALSPGDVPSLAAALADWRNRTRAESWSLRCASFATPYSVAANVHATLAVLGLIPPAPTSTARV